MMATKSTPNAARFDAAKALMSWKVRRFTPALMQMAGAFFVISFSINGRPSGMTKTYGDDFSPNRSSQSIKSLGIGRVLSSPFGGASPLYVGWRWLSTVIVNAFRSMALHLSPHTSPRRNPRKSAQNIGPSIQVPLASRITFSVKSFSRPERSFFFFFAFGSLTNSVGSSEIRLRPLASLKMAFAAIITSRLLFSERIPFLNLALRSRRFRPSFNAWISSNLISWSCFSPKTGRM